ncbi:type I phosphomannose isomerase catalytic subunit [Kineococcus sp. SYSU DK005]|uniref:type I phosphomannose isomerase catalytic subunit n=1 Tax=Kineococcus sp. SYSU DK005 TaxID=3383126 RepID=UPI003D7DCB6A
MEWYPLRLSTSVKQHVFGGRAVADVLGRSGLPEGPVAETWEVSDVDGEVGVVADGPLAGTPLRDLVREHPGELVGPGWSGSRFPILTKLIDGHRALPVHVHADDAAAREFEGQENGKTEAWHVLAAGPGATALAGVRPDVGPERLREALLAQDFDAVLERFPVAAGDTVYVPGGTVHSFGPDTLVYEIEQTSDTQQHAMPYEMQDGSPVPEQQRRENVEALLREARLDARASITDSTVPADDDGVRRALCCQGPYFVLRRWRSGHPVRVRREFGTAQVLTNIGRAPVAVHAGAWSGELARASTFLLPAALGAVEVEGELDLLWGHLPS